MAKALHYALARKASLQVFLADPAVAIDTNHLERALRPIPKGKKNWLFAWTEIGAERVGVIQSLLITCRLQGVDPYTYLVDVMCAHQRASGQPRHRAHAARVEDALLQQSHEIRPGVGPAITAWNGRLRSRRIFLRHKAPVRGFLSQCAIGSVVHHAIERAGVQAPTHGTHQFRHALATRMLRGGASLIEIGELLGHRSPETTKIYTKVDVEALRALALPWPGGGK